MQHNLSPEAAKAVATQRYWDGVIDGLKEADRLATRWGASKDQLDQLADRLARAERCRARVIERAS